MKIKFAILINLNINNKCYLQNYNILDNYKKIGTFNYLCEIGENWEDFDNETKLFENDAKTIISKDGCGQKTEFYFVAYLPNEDGKIEDMKKIKQLFY